MNFALFATLLILGNYIIEQNKLITKKGDWLMKKVQKHLDGITKIKDYNDKYFVVYNEKDMLSFVTKDNVRICTCRLLVSFI